MYPAELELSEVVKFLLSNGINASIHKGEIFTNHTTSKRNFTMRVAIPSTFPCTPPNFHLVDRDSYGGLAHVAWGENGYADICFGAGEHFSTNIDEPFLVILDTLKLAEKIVRRGIEDLDFNKKELIREFGGVWRFHVKNNSTPLLSTITSLNEIQELTVRSATRDNPSYGLGSVIIASDNVPNSSFAVNVSARSPNRQIEGKAIYLPVPSQLSVLPPAPYESLIDWWTVLLGLLDYSLNKKLKLISRTTKSKKCYLIIGLTINGQLAQIAIEFGNEKKSQLPLDTLYLAGWTATAVNVDDMSAQNLLRRGGAEKGLSNKRVCLIGCGSVGGYIAQSLASSGLGYLTLIDFDTYRPENIHRHILPARYLYYLKTIALRNYIQANMPFVKVTTLESQLLSLDFNKFNQYDLIVVATGNVSHERQLNKVMKANGITVPVIYTWQEAYGVGGHAVLSLPNKEGCLECTYIGLDSDEPELFNNLNFISPGQKIVKGHVGCGTEFLPYSNLDAQDTANLASRLTLTVVRDGMNEGMATSWRKKNQEADFASVEFTHRYKYLNNIDELRPIANKRCICCGK